MGVVVHSYPWRIILPVTSAEFIIVILTNRFVDCVDDSIFSLILIRPYLTFFNSFVSCVSESGNYNIIMFTYQCCVIGMVRVE